MRGMVGAALGLLFAASAAAQTVPLEQLARPPAHARTFSLVSTSGRHGTASEWTAADGTLMARLDLVLRGQAYHLEEATRLGPDGAIHDYVLRGSTPNGDAAETFRVTGGKAVWRSQVDAGSAAYVRPAFYLPAAISIRPGEIATEWLIAHPQARGVSLLPGGEQRVERLAQAEVGRGATRKTIVLWKITGVSSTPTTVWTGLDGHIFATVGFLSFMPTGYEADAPRLNAIQDAEIAKLSPALARKLGGVATGNIAFRDVQLLAPGGRWLKHQTLIVAGGRIAAFGPVDATTIPLATKVIEGAGRTIVPGLWDSHIHVTDDFTGLRELSLGVTSIRDPGNNDELTLSRRRRRAAGDLLAPHVHASSLIDGKGLNTSQTATVVTTQAEAMSAVAAARDKGMSGVKFYGSIDPAWIAPAAAEAHRLGLHVHGHLPAGMRPSEAIRRGYDELTHIYFVSMEAMPDAVVAQSNGIARFTGTGRYMKDVDLDAEPMASLIATMVAKRIAVDPTLVVAESLFMPENGDLSPAYAPYAGSLPPATERGFRQGGLSPAQGATREDYRASFAKLQALVGRLHKAGVPILAGTDGSGLELVRELELYVAAGFTTGEAVEAATIVPALILGADAHTGSIVVGKDADLVVIDGDPSNAIGDLRNTHLVLMGGRLMSADDLRTAAGISRRPSRSGVR